MSIEKGQDAERRCEVVRVGDGLKGLVWRACVQSKGGGIWLFDNGWTRCICRTQGVYWSCGRYRGVYRCQCDRPWNSESTLEATILETGASMPTRGGLELTSETSILAYRTFGGSFEALPILIHQLTRVFAKVVLPLPGKPTIITFGPGTSSSMP